MNAPLCAHRSIGKTRVTWHIWGIDPKLDLAFLAINGVASSNSASV